MAEVTSNKMLMDKLISLEDRFNLLRTALIQLEPVLQELVERSRNTAAIEEEMRPMLDMAKKAAKFGKLGGGRYGR